MNESGALGIKHNSVWKDTESQCNNFENIKKKAIVIVPQLGPKISTLSANTTI